MNRVIFIVLVFYFTVCSSVCYGQVDSVVFDKKMKSIQLFVETQQYNQALEELKSIDELGIQELSIGDLVEYRLLNSRVLRLLSFHKEAMTELNKIPPLEDHVELMLSVDFRKAALYIDDGNYSIEEKRKYAGPILERSIKKAREIGATNNLAGFFNLSAAIFRYETDQNLPFSLKYADSAKVYYKKSMNLFLEARDTNNYHNVLNGLFALELGHPTNELDSIKELVEKYTEISSYVPNMISSRNNLSGYYLWYKKDSVKHLQEALKAVNAHSQQIIKNSDKTLEKMKLLYEFDSLKSDINFNKKIVSEQSKTISQKNTSIMLSVGITVLLAVFIIFIFILFRKQKKLSSQKNEMNQALEKSVHNYQLLIRESNHRIKNNLQMILSMLALDMESLEEKDKDLLANISSKISTISALHRILNFKEHNEKVKLSTYFDEILAYYNDISTEKLQFTTDYAKIYIPSERVIYFGLVLNELIANTIKHRKETGEIVIQVLKSDNELIFYYRDNSNFGEFQKNSGFELMEGLIERFGARNLVFNAENGEFKFYFDE